MLSTSIKISQYYGGSKSDSQSKLIKWFAYSVTSTSFKVMNSLLELFYLSFSAYKILFNFRDLSPSPSNESPIHYSKSSSKFKCLVNILVEQNV